MNWRTMKSNQEQYETADELVILEEKVARKDLIVFNDDVNTFDHVIDSLITVCEHEPMQAEQCTWIIHHNGKCQVKRGTYSMLVPMCTALLERGISAEIQ